MKRRSFDGIFASALALSSVVMVLVLCLLRACTGHDWGLFEEAASVLLDEPLVIVEKADWYELYFTNPQEDPAWRGGLDEILEADIDQAEAYIDIAAYDFDLQSVTDALIRAHARGVEVRMVIDSENLDLDQPQDLIDAGIVVVEDDRSAIMHDKFVVIDGIIVWTGSWNLTDNGTYRNNNNAIRIISGEMAANFTYEFEEMFLDDEFGPDSPADTPHRRIIIDGTRLETYFAPEDSVMEQVIELVSRASESIRFMAFSFTADDLGTVLREKAATGVLVEGVFEARGADSEFSQFSAMLDAGMNVWKDGNSAIMHHKVIIIDGGIVMLGSFNFSQNADKSNDENLLVIYDREIAGHFLDEFDRVISQAYP